MRTLLYHTRYYTAVQVMYYCTNKIVFTLHKIAGKATYGHCYCYCQLPLPNGATLHFHRYSISNQTAGYLLVNAAKACPSPVQLAPRRNYASSCQRSFCAVQFHWRYQRHTFQDRHTAVETSDQPSAYADCDMTYYTMLLHDVQNYADCYMTYRTTLTDT
jgi:protein-arginine kinase activator protein McsA